MIQPIPWTHREFTFDQPIGVFPAVLERLRGTPPRASALVTGVSEEILGTRVNEKWSVKEHLGHLVDLHALDETRLREFQNRVPVLSKADMSNSATEHGNHRETPVAEILEKMRIGRNALVHQLEVMTEEDVAVAAMHPRLHKSMRLLDWAYFVAEHDDHHLAHVARAIRELTSRPQAHRSGEGIVR